MYVPSATHDRRKPSPKVAVDRVRPVMIRNWNESPKRWWRLFVALGSQRNVATEEVSSTIWMSM